MRWLPFTRWYFEYVTFNTHNVLSKCRVKQTIPGNLLISYPKRESLEADANTDTLSTVPQCLKKKSFYWMLRFLETWDHQTIAYIRSYYQQSARYKQGEKCSRAMTVRIYQHKHT